MGGIKKKFENHVFGIDLGTTYSCISYIDDYGMPAIIPDLSYGTKFTVPSVVMFERDKSVIAGWEAKKAFESAANTVTCIKREMGDKDAGREIDGAWYTPQHISAQILMRLKKNAQKELKLSNDEVMNVVITCPAYFGQNQIAATKYAGEIAGLNVLSVISEPTAAALFYFSEKGRVGDAEKNIMVYDLGGGTFDVTYITFCSGEVVEVCTSGDHHLGGKDWDDALKNYVKQRYVELTSEQAVLHPDEELDLDINIEKLKYSLSELKSSKIRVKPTFVRSHCTRI